MPGLILLPAALRIGGLLDFNIVLLSDYKRSCKVPYAVLHYLYFCLFSISFSISLSRLLYSPICWIQWHENHQYFQRVFVLSGVSWQKKCYRFKYARMNEWMAIHNTKRDIGNLRKTLCYVKFHFWNCFSGAFAKLRKATFSFVTSLCPSVPLSVRPSA